MSLHVLRLIPTDPAWTPSQAGAEEAARILVELFPASPVASTVYDETIFIDQGGNFEEVRCPRCRAVIAGEWWGDRMDEAAATSFTDLAVVTPCCHLATSLNDLDYRMPAGFARFELSVSDWNNGGSTGLAGEELQSVVAAVGHDLRQVLARY